MFLALLVCAANLLQQSQLRFICSSVAPCGSVMLNCSQPDPPSLLSALEPAFNLSFIRPVVNMSTPTTVGIGFTLYAIMGVVRDHALL